MQKGTAAAGLGGIAHSTLPGKEKPLGFYFKEDMPQAGKLGSQKTSLKQLQYLAKQKAEGGGTDPLGFYFTQVRKELCADSGSLRVLRLFRVVRRGGVGW